LQKASDEQTLPRKKVQFTPLFLFSSGKCCLGCRVDNLRILIASLLI
jgi:hypothetical protein